jgi:hypothetical protein
MGREEKAPSLLSELSFRQLRALMFLSDGRANLEVARMIGVSERLISRWRRRNPRFRRALEALKDGTIHEGEFTRAFIMAGLTWDPLSD